MFVVRTLRARVVGLLILLTAALGPVSTADAQKVPAGFKAELIYDAPEIEHPSVVTCDDAGNLFVGEDPMDMRGPTTKEFDRVILVRWDAEGKPRRTVFCDKLSAVFGLVWHDGALYVMHAPHYTMFKDTDGDGVADVRKDLANGFGPPAGVYGFNDHIVTGTRLGLDGKVYVSVGDKGIPKATGSDGSTISLEGGGVVRMGLDGSQLEVVTSGTRNHLDVAMDSLDNIFTYDNTDDGLGWWTRFTHHVPTGYYGYPYDYHPHADRHLPRISEHGGGSPVGAACYTGAAWPETYRESPFHCEWGKGKIQRFKLAKSGASFTAEIEDFMTHDGKDEFRPLDLCFSPDGKTMYVADWNFSGWVNPKVCGRLFKVTYVGEGAGELPAAISGGASLEAKLKALGHPNHDERMRAQFQIVKLGALAARPLHRLLVGDAAKDATKMAKVHAIWAEHQLANQLAGYDPAADWIAALADKDADVRGQAARALGERRAKAGAPALCKALKDDDAGVRMRVAIALGRIGDSLAAAPLFDALGEQDLYARFTMIQALRALNDWTLAQQHLDSTDKYVRVATTLALTGVYDQKAVEALAWAARNAQDPAIRALAVEAIAEVHRKADPYEKGWWGTQPARGEPARPKKHDWTGTPLVLATLRDSLKSSDESVRQAAMHAIAVIKDPESLPTILAMARDGKTPLAVRLEAVKALVSMKVEPASKALVEIIGDPAAPPEILTLGLDGVANNKVAAAAPAVEKLLDSASPAVRAKAVATLAKVSGASAAERLTKSLADADLEVRRAVVRALGDVTAREAIPALLPLGADSQLRGDVLSTLARMPDRRALAIYLDGLVDANPGNRDLARVALTAIRDVIAQDIVALKDRNELPGKLRAELQSVFDSPSPIMSWQVAGPWPKGKPPTFDTTQAANLAAPLTINDKQVAWKQMSAGAQGRVTLNGKFSPDEGVWAVAYATIEADEAGTAPFMLGSDDQAQLWVNGQKIYEFKDNRGWAADSGRGAIELKKGTNHIWFYVCNDTGPWDFSLAVGGRSEKFAFLYDNVPAKLDMAVYREHALKNVGDATRGRAIFADAKGVGGIKCHAVRGEGGKIGPDLIGVGAKYPREELVRSVLEPSNRVAAGYQVTTVITDGGKILQGIVKSDTEDAIELLDAEGRSTKIPKSEVDERQTSNVSLMPNGLKDGLTLEAFADIVAYLESLKQPQ